MWTTENDYHIEKSRLPVVLITMDGVRAVGDVFVQPSARNIHGHETALDLLNSIEPFFPLASQGGQIVLVAKDHVRELFVAREDAEPADWALGIAAELAVQLRDGTVHRGTVLMEVASANSRVLDFLNRCSARFIALYNDNGVVLINRASVMHVVQRT